MVVLVLEWSIRLLLLIALFLTEEFVMELRHICEMLLVDWSMVDAGLNGEFFSPRFSLASVSSIAVVVLVSSGVPDNRVLGDPFVLVAVDDMDVLPPLFLCGDRVRRPYLLENLSASWSPELEVVVNGADFDSKAGTESSANRKDSSRIQRDPSCLDWDWN